MSVENLRNELMNCITAGNEAAGLLDSAAGLTAESRGILREVCGDAETPLAAVADQQIYCEGRIRDGEEGLRRALLILSDYVTFLESAGASSDAGLPNLPSPQNLLKARARVTSPTTAVIPGGKKWDHLPSSTVPGAMLIRPDADGRDIAALMERSCQDGISETELAEAEEKGLKGENGIVIRVGDLIVKKATRLRTDSSLFYIDEDSPPDLEKFDQLIGQSAFVANAILEQGLRNIAPGRQESLVQYTAPTMYGCLVPEDPEKPVIHLMSYEEGTPAANIEQKSEWVTENRNSTYYVTESGLVVPGRQSRRDVYEQAVRSCGIDPYKIDYDDDQYDEPLNILVREDEGKLVIVKHDVSALKRLELP